MDATNPATEVPDGPAPPIAEESGSLADHEARYKDGGHAEPEKVEAATEAATPPAEQPEPESDPTKAESEDEYGPRDEKGKFLPKKRHRAQSQEATPADVPRIRELTARLRAAEAERDAFKARVGDSRPVSPAVPATAPPPPSTPKPTPDKFEDYSAYVEALTDWKTDQKLAAAEQQRAQAEQQRQADQERQRLTKSWTERVTAAKTKYPDFAEVALEADTRIPPGSLIDAWILEHKTGAEMLYYLQQHPDQIEAILQQPVLEQAESLALLAQRFNGHANGRTPAAATGSAATSASSPPPKPPNPVRTGPVRAGDEPPDEEHASLADHERYYQPRRARRG